MITLQASILCAHDDENYENEGDNDGGGVDDGDGGVDNGGGGDNYGDDPIPGANTWLSQQEP